MNILRNKIFYFLFILIILPILCKENIIECGNGGTKCDLNNGKCINKSFCKCNKGYITYPENNEIKCNYHKKSKLIAILLEFIFCFGFGLLYIRKYIHFIIKFSCSLLMFYLYQKYSVFKEKNSRITLIIVSVVFLGMLICQIYDISCLFKNKYLDENAIPLRTW